MKILKKKIMRIVLANGYVNSMCFDYDLIKLFLKENDYLW